MGKLRLTEEEIKWRMLIFEACIKHAKQTIPQNNAMWDQAEGAAKMIEEMAINWREQQTSQEPLIV